MLLPVLIPPRRKELKIDKVASQFHVVDPERAKAACGITCLWMVFHYTDSSFNKTLQELHDEEIQHDWHYHPEDGLWLQTGSAQLARQRGLKAMSINLHSLGSKKEDIENMYTSGRLSARELNDYRSLLLSLSAIKSFEGKLTKTLQLFLSKKIPVMVSMKPGYKTNTSNHRVLCIGYDKNEAYILDPLEREPKPERMTFQKIAEQTTGNILVVYKNGWLPK